MFSVKGFFDYNISEKCFEGGQLDTSLALLYEYGYRTIAINQVIDLQAANEQSENGSRKKKGQVRDVPDPVPEPFAIPNLEKYQDMKVLNRLTVIFSTQDVLYKITKSPHFKKYDILAVMPLSQPAALFVCNTFEADIFCFNIENKGAIRRSRKMYNQLIERGYHFEIPYSPAIEDRGKRKSIIMVSHVLHTMAKSRNVIISSGATSPYLIRSPYDIINLGLIFGLNEHQSKNAVLHEGIQVYYNSISRRQGKAVMFVEEDKTKIEVSQSTQAEDIILLELSDEETETEQPASKKAKV